MHEMTWIKWNEWIEMKELKRMNWNEWIAMNEVTWIDIEWIEMHNLKWMNCQKHSEPFIFYDFYVKSTSRYSLVHIFRPPVQKWWPKGVNFCDICVKSKSRTHFVYLILQKWSGGVRRCQFFCDVYLKPSPRYSLVHICLPHLPVFSDFYLKSSSRYSFMHILSTTFPDRGAHPRKQRPSSGRPLYPKEHRASRPGTFSAVNSRVPDRSHFSTTCRCYGWHHDVVLMIMWLTWWCDSWLWESFVIRKFPN